MQILIRELRELVRGPEFLAIVLICLLLGVDAPVRTWIVEAPARIEDRVGRILAVCPVTEALEQLQRVWPSFR